MAATNSVSTAEDSPSAAVAIGASDVDGDSLSYAVKSGAEPSKGAVSFADGGFHRRPLWSVARLVLSAPVPGIRDRDRAVRLATDMSQDHGIGIDYPITAGHRRHEQGKRH